MRLMFVLDSRRLRRACMALLLMAPAAMAAGQGASASREPATDARSANIERTLQLMLDAARDSARWPGATLALALPDGRVISVASGFSDTTRKVPMRTSDRLLQGSVGKTYVAAALVYWAGGIEPLYLEGALERAQPS